MKIKICGLFRETDIDAVNEAKPDFAGFVFASSRRQVTSAQAKILRRLLDPGIMPVGVFADTSIEQIATLFEEGTIGMAQLHGHETEATIRALKQRIGVPIIKAIRVSHPEDILGWVGSGADYLLLDNGSGGTGTTFDWQLIPPIAKPFFLAGGIDENNIRQAKSLIPSPWAIDVSSGVETGGVKDRLKIMKLVHMVREEYAN